MMQIDNSRRMLFSSQQNVRLKLYFSSTPILPKLKYSHTCTFRFSTAPSSCFSNTRIFRRSSTNFNRFTSRSKKFSIMFFYRTKFLIRINNNCRINTHLRKKLDCKERKSTSSPSLDSLLRA